MTELSFLSKEEIQFRDEARSFVQRNLTPHAEDIEQGKLEAWDVLRKFGKAGYLGSRYPVEFGGTGKGLMYEVLVTEEICAVHAGLDMARVASCILFAHPVYEFGTESQKKKYLTPVAKGEKIGALGITEPNVGSDVAATETRAEKQGDNYVINGEKRFITNGPVADFLLCYTVTDPKVKAKQGMTAFIVETKSKGFEVVEEYDLLGMHGAHVGRLAFKDLEVPKENILGDINGGFRVVMAGLNAERTILAAEMNGVARASMEEAIHYSNYRVQFRRKIREFEGVSFKIADMAMKLEAARLLTFKAARIIDANKPATKDAAIAKLFACETAIESASQALQVLGGIGYTKQKPVERYLRDARLMTIGGGTAEILRYLIQREVFKEYDL
ncbi:MAG: acyl-CoA dehydrogenase family protein [Candidatus Hermodarchaeota archaeon]